MLGLDTGWNCHISLANDTNMQNISKTVNYDSSNDQNSIASGNFKIRNKKFQKRKVKTKKLSKRLWVKRNISINRKLSHGSSLPNLKFTNYSSMNSNSHCVKFNLRNSVKKKKRSRKLSRLNSVDRSSFCSGDSIDTISENYKMKNISNLNDTSSLKSSSILNNTGKYHKKLSSRFDDDYSIHSGRSLSETEIYGNAVLFFLNLNTKKYLNLFQIF